MAFSDNSQTVPDISLNAIRAQVFNADGSARGGEFLVNTETQSFQLSPSITALSSGGFVIAWTDESGLGQDTSESGVKARIYSAAGAALGGEFLLNTITTGGPVCAGHCRTCEWRHRDRLD